ncbi:MAG: hypothetical protein ACRDZ2_11990, partial [Ilumatobacteraceae bacterium]
LIGKDQAMQALLPAARLHLARGDHDLARATAQRGLRAAGEDRLRTIELLTTLVDVELAAGDLEAARAACADLEARADQVPVPSLAGRAAAAQARSLSASGCDTDALALLERTVDALDADRLPWLRAALLIELARQRLRCGDRAGAAADASAARAALAQLDVVLGSGDVDLLAGLGRKQATRSVATAELVDGGSWWTATCDGVSVRLSDTKGLGYLAELMANPGAERHALDLVDRVEGVEAGIDRRTFGDAGPLLDSAARTAYRRRIEQLRADAEDALAEERLEDAETARAELDQLVGQLAQAFGLGGQARRAGSVAERARLNVTRALRSAITKLTDALPKAGATLDRDVRTGTYCAYTPIPGELRWIVQRAMNTSRRD